MLPLNGSTVWVKFKGKLYLGKLIQSNIKLDMFCVRIMNYFNYNNQAKTAESFLVRSCPDNFTKYLNKSVYNNDNDDDDDDEDNCKEDDEDEDENEESPNSIVITCGKEDIYAINDDVADKIKMLNYDTDVGFREFDILSFQESISSKVITPIDDVTPGISDSFKIQNILQQPLTTKPNHTDHYQKYTTQNYDDEEDDDDNDEEDDEEEDKETEVNCDKYVNKGYQCRHCKVWKKDENEIKSHVLNAHQLDTLLETENNWVVIGGIEGFNYDEVTYSTESNIKYLNNIHLSCLHTHTSSHSPPVSTSVSSVASAIRKRHFLLESLPQPLYSSSNMISTSNVTTQSTVDCSQFTLPIPSNIPRKTCPFLNSFAASWEPDINKRSSIGDSIFTDSYEMSSSVNKYHANSSISTSSQNPIQQSSSTTSSQHILQALLSNNNETENSDFLLSTYPQNSSKLFINFSIKDKDNAVTNFSSPPKRSRLEGTVKKCRKMYGIEQRHLWCNQCKWKKACSRFTKENIGLTKSFN